MKVLLLDEKKYRKYATIIKDSIKAVLQSNIQKMRGRRNVPSQKNSDSLEEIKDNEELIVDQDDSISKI